MQTLVWQKNVVVDKYYGHTCSWKRVKGLKLYFTFTTTFSAPWMLGNRDLVMLGGLSSPTAADAAPTVHHLDHPGWTQPTPPPPNVPWLQFI